MNSLCERFESISWKKVHLIVLGITFSILVTGICGYFIGTFRPDYIKKFYHLYCFLSVDITR